MAEPKNGLYIVELSNDDKGHEIMVAFETVQVFQPAGRPRYATA
jgi:hypothetical protein